MPFWKLEKSIIPNAAEAAIITDTPMLTKWNTDRIMVLYDTWVGMEQTRERHKTTRKQKHKRKEKCDKKECYYRYCCMTRASNFRRVAVLLYCCIHMTRVCLP